MERRTKNGRKEYQCSLCKKWYEFDDSTDNIAVKECKDIWKTEPDDRFDVVCDDCWKITNPLLSENKELYELELSK